MANKGMKGLLVWCKKHTEGYRDVNVTNMTSSWKDGLAFCALLHRFRPDLIDFDSLSKENVLYNNQLAFEIAERELDIAALLDAEDMANMRIPDKLSVMTYLSQYYNCFRHCNPTDNPVQVSSPVVNPSTTGSPAKSSFPSRRPTDDSICCICGKRVHLVQRYFEDGCLYHRTCHRSDSLEKIRGKNYFIKPQSKKDESENNEIDDQKPKLNDKNTNAQNVADTKQTKKELGLPNLVESLGNAQVKTVNISSLTPSPSQETKTLPEESLVSELPVAKSKSGESEIKVMPKPRTRTVTNEKPKTAPVASPRFKNDESKPSADSDDKKTHTYDKSKNPFEMDSGSDSDTTLSSTSSEEDETNPFASATQKQTHLNQRDETEEVNVQKDSGNPFGDETDDVVHNNETQHEGLNPFGEPEEETVTPVIDRVVKNKKPIQVAGEVPDPLERFNPFSANFKEDNIVGSDDGKLQKKKKRPAPIPPTVKLSSPIPQRPTSSPSKKLLAPSRPKPWKDEADQKMIEMNKANEKDPRFSKSVEHEPASSPKSPAKTAQLSSRQARPKEKVTSPKARSAPGYGYPLVKRKVSIKMSEEEIANELKLLDVQLTDYETKGVKLEEMLRFNMDSDLEWTNEEDELLQEWFELVNKKNILLREESDLVFQLQQQKLEQEHAEIEFQLRKLFNKPESTKTDQDKITEENLLQKLLEVVERRNVIINSIEEERLKEAEEDSAYERMKRLHKNPSKKKKKNKVKKIFSKKEKKDKQRTDKKTQS